MNKLFAVRCSLFTKLMTEEEKKEEQKPEEQRQEKMEEKPEPSAAADSVSVAKPTPAKEAAKADKKPEPKVADKVKEEKIEVPAKFKKLVDEIEKMSIMDLAKLVKILEKKFGVSPVVAASVAAGGGAEGPATAGEEKSEFNIELKDGGSQKIQVIKVVREVTGKGLKEAKDIVDGAPKVIKENVKKEEAEEIKKKLEEAGASVELK
jgi:large subunit ribosomal protein L7/L12